MIGKIEREHIAHSSRYYLQNFKRLFMLRVIQNISTSMNQIHGKHHVHCFAVALGNDNIVIALDCRAYLFNGLLQFA